MTTDTYVESTQWAPGQNNPDVTVNTYIAAGVASAHAIWSKSLTGLTSPLDCNSGSIGSNANRLGWLQSGWVRCTGTLTGTFVIRVPAVQHRCVVENNTTGGYNIVVNTTSGGSPEAIITIAPGRWAEIQVGTSSIRNVLNGALGGVSISNPTTGDELYYNGSIWTNRPARVILPFFFGDPLTGGATAAQIVVSNATFDIKIHNSGSPTPDNGSNAYAATTATGVGSPTAGPAFSIKKNGSSFGSVTFPVATNVGIVAITANTSFARGDRLSITAPVVADATLANVSITLQGVRT